MTEITLKYPVTLATGKVIDKLSLRRPKVRDLKAVQRAHDKSEEQELALLSLLAGLTPEDIEELDLADYKSIQDTFRGMLDAV